MTSDWKKRDFDHIRSKRGTRNWGVREGGNIRGRSISQCPWGEKRGGVMHSRLGSWGELLPKERLRGFAEKGGGGGGASWEKSLRDFHPGGGGLRESWE